MSVCGHLSVGQINNGKSPACFAHTVCLRIRPLKTGNWVGARLVTFVLLIWQEARQMAKFARCSFAKTTANCSNSFCHFHLISSMSWPQRPLIYILVHILTCTIFYMYIYKLSILKPTPKFSWYNVVP